LNYSIVQLYQKHVT